MTPAHGKRGLAAAAAFVALAATFALAGSADAGNEPTAQNLLLEISIDDPAGNAHAVLDAITPELFTDPGGTNIAGSQMCVTTPDTTTVSSTTFAAVSVACALPIGDSFRLGDANPPAGFSANLAVCNTDQLPVEALPGDDRIFTAGALLTNCSIFIGPTPTLYVDKIVDGGTATASDFELEIYDVDGVQVDIGTVVDPSDELCTLAAPGGPMVDLANCAAIPLANGNYTFGEVLPDYGYIADQLDCAPIDSFQGSEKLRSPAFDFGHSPKAPDTYCTITNTHVTDVITVDIVVVNDSGRSASGDEFLIEVYDNTGTLVDSAVDPEPGVGNASATFTLPIGPYTLGVSGPDGYDGTAEVVVDEQPRALIPGQGAQFTLGDFATTAVVTVNDRAVVTTTATPTTATPTSAAPVTMDPNAVLPATGSDSTTSTMLLIALACLAFGGLTVAGTRRR
jgi:LPXTG-motif cell wall-anchored protein